MFRKASSHPLKKSHEEENAQFQSKKGCENYEKPPMIIITEEQQSTDNYSRRLNVPSSSDSEGINYHLQDNSTDSFESALSDISSQSSSFTGSPVHCKEPSLDGNSFTNGSAKMKNGRKVSLSVQHVRFKDAHKRNRDNHNSKRLMPISFAKSNAASEGLLVQGENRRGRPTLILRPTDSRTTTNNTIGTSKQRPEWSRSVVNKAPNRIKYEAVLRCIEINSEIHMTSRCEKMMPEVKFKKMAENTSNVKIVKASDCCCCENVTKAKECPCVKEIQQLRKELQGTQSKMAEFYEKMEDRSSARNQPTQEHQRYLSRPSEFNVLNPEEMSYPVFSQGSCNPLHQMYTPSRTSSHGYNAHPALGRTMSYQRHPYGDCERVPNYDVAPNHPSCFLRRSNDDGNRRDASEFVSQLAHQDPQVLANLRDQIMALQMRNLELNLFLKKEELQRKEAEEAVRRDRTYIKALEDNIQTLSATRVVMDPLTYKQVADNYMASRKKPVRRTRTCNPCSLGSEDLVCDAQNQSLQVRKQSTSCPSSPLGAKATLKVKEATKKRLSQPIYNDDDNESCSPIGERSSTTSPAELSPSTSLSFSSSPFNSIPLTNDARSQESPSINNWSIQGLSSTPLNQEEYQRLLESIEKLDMSAPS